MINLHHKFIVLPIHRDFYMKKLLLFVIAFSIHIAADAANDFSTLEERMNGKEFKETGLGKLTDQELANLNAWLRRHSVATLENASASPAAGAISTESTEDTRGLRKKTEEDTSDKVINGTIVGTFDGWDSKGTLFKLTNGMIWQQAESDSFSVKAVENAEVTITRGFMGNWRLSMVGYSSAVNVKRIK
jgi:hypothetical protein